MKNVGLFFGSFNPIHIGHLIVATQLKSAANLDEVWFVVSPHSPFKPQSELAAEDLRLEWVKKSVANTSFLKTCDLEFKLPKPSYTYLTLEKLHELYDHHFHLIMGLDTLQSLPDWRNAIDFMNKYPIHVYQRGGFYNITNAIAKNIVMHNLPLLDISASFIRAQVLAKKPINFMVDVSILDAVEAYYR